jgi:hypothetical protein
MKASNVWESVITTVAATVTTELAAKSVARLMSIQFRPDTLLICGLLTAWWRRTGFTGGARTAA